MYEEGSFSHMLISWRTIFFSISVSSEEIFGSQTMSATNFLATSEVSFRVMP